MWIVKKLKKNRQRHLLARDILIIIYDINVKVISITCIGFFW